MCMGVGVQAHNYTLLSKVRVLLAGLDRYRRHLRHVIDDRTNLQFAIFDRINQVGVHVIANVNASAICVHDTTSRSWCLR